MTERSPETIRLWALGFLFVAGLAVVIAVIVGVATSDGPDTGARSSDVPSSQPQAPDFSIPKLSGCRRAQPKDLGTIVETLRPRLQLSAAYIATERDITYIAATLEADRRPVAEPGLWAIRQGDVFAVGPTIALSSAPSAETIRVFGDTDAAGLVVACAAGY
ncbi:hypothetical protein [Gordonia alkanivorans]|uniref:hypothetical protein n=1 Tax=Gordonia alkanivorans TaxID=84096 RepID=UPI0004B874DA|nr:hypothetical protein [Gordonia alkanivorans]